MIHTVQPNYNIAEPRKANHGKICQVGECKDAFIVSGWNQLDNPETDRLGFVYDTAALPRGLEFWTDHQLSR